MAGSEPGRDRDRIFGSTDLARRFGAEVEGDGGVGTRIAGRCRWEGLRSLAAGGPGGRLLSQPGYRGAGMAQALSSPLPHELGCEGARKGAEIDAGRTGRQGENVAMLAAGDLLFFLTTDAELMVVEPGADRFDPVARFSVADSPTWAHPVVLGSRFLIKDASTVALWGLPPRGNGRPEIKSPASPDSL